MPFSFEDTNLNARYDDGEPPLPGGQLLVEEASLPVESVDGVVCEREVPTGVATVRGLAPAGYNLTTAPGYTAQILAGAQLDLRFGAATGFGAAQVLPADQSTLTPPLPAHWQAPAVQGEETWLAQLYALSSFLVLGLAGIVLIGGLGLVILLRRWR
ncbi:MAG: hypothetical protein HC915_03570 [Anaerolineae bacterium]|nr:hypothetical protein [Anaerolineae bacterium]